MLSSIARACTSTKALESLRKAQNTSPKHQPQELQSLIDMVNSLTLSSFGPVSSYRSKVSVLPDSLLEIEKTHPGLSKPFSPPSYFAPSDAPPVPDHLLQNGHSEFVSHMTTLYTDPEERFVFQIFFLPKGCVMPLHDHPHMSVVSKVIHGAIDVSSYSLNLANPPQATPKQPNFNRRSRSLAVTPYNRAILSAQDSDSSLSLLLPASGNFHAMRALEHTLFFDILSPPYNPPAIDCTYYKIERYTHDTNELIGTEDERDSVHTLFANASDTKDLFFIRPFDPSFFHCYEFPWMGPQITL